ncbi:MAG TPA: FAD-dependent oxidoreductase [Acidimicrobiales bacterium]
MSRKKVLVLGGNFAGLTAALAVKHDLDGDVDVTVVSASDRFLFNPSLIWLPFGKRSPSDITFPVAPTFESHEVDFVHAEATRLDLPAKKVETGAGEYAYDYLVIATGYRNNFDAVEGLGPGGNAYTITTLDDAVHAGEGWRRFLDNPGDIVIGATEGAGCFGAAYEYLFNVSYQLRKAGLKKRVGLTYVTPEPVLGHFGIGGLPHGEQLLGMFMRKERIASVIDTAIDHVDEGRVVLEDGTGLDFAYAMIIPPFLGQDVVKRATDIADDKGYVKVRDTYQTEAYDDVYAVGIAAAVPVPWQTAHAVGIPKTGLPAEQMAHVAAKNIVSQVKGEPPQAHKAFGDIPAVCVLDAGNNGVLILADKMLPPRKHGVLIPGPQSHAMKLAFEKYFLWKARHGYVSLP